MKSSKKFRYLQVVLGVLLIAAGLILIKAVKEPEGLFRVLPFVFLGIGCGVFGSGVGALVSSWALKNEPQLQKQMEIEQKDERNIAIANQAKAKAFDAMLYLFGALMITFALMMVELPAILLLVVAYLVVDGIFIYYLSKFHKEM